MTNPRHEESWERTDRNLNDLLQELRVALPGVQVLFAFLLAVPFQSRFGSVTGFQESLYFATLIFTACSSLLLIAPTAFHRLTFRRQQKERLLLFANRFMIWGLAFLALAVTGAVTLITDYLYGSIPTIAAGVTSLAAFGMIWLYFPLRARYG
jgi:predicted neutral ceramidase superfamily lipid hydrolase